MVLKPISGLLASAKSTCPHRIHPHIVLYGEDQVYEDTGECICILQSSTKFLSECTQADHQYCYLQGKEATEKVNNHSKLCTDCLVGEGIPLNNEKAVCKLVGETVSNHTAEKCTRFKGRSKL